jgi:hypothetical protein
MTDQYPNSAKPSQNATVPVATSTGLPPLITAAGGRASLSGIL